MPLTNGSVSGSGSRRPKNIGILRIRIRIRICNTGSHCSGSGELSAGGAAHGGPGSYPAVGRLLCGHRGPLHRPPHRLAPPHAGQPSASRRENTRHNAGIYFNY